MKKGIAVLGSTGSIGKQALDVIGRNRDLFDLRAITAGDNASLLVEQARQYLPSVVAIANEKLYKQVKEGLSSFPVKVLAGNESLTSVVVLPEVDIVLTAMVGFAGFAPTIAAIRAGKNIALANKETLVVAGEIVTSLARKHKVGIYPVDSEHSAIFQCLIGEDPRNIEKLILTGSGGPFRGWTKQQLANASNMDALKHPNWRMGRKITIDSATLMNKGLEAIEAHWLFSMEPERIDVVIHPQSIIHSLVQFTDGSIKAQMGLPDMRLPIQFALSYPDRLKSDFPRFGFSDFPQLTFEKPDTSLFRSLTLAFEAMRCGGNMPCILNASNEIVVNAFLKGWVSFLRIPEIIEQAMEKISFIKAPTLEDYMETDRITRVFTSNLIH